MSSLALYTDLELVATWLFLASKVCEQPRKIRDCINVCYQVWGKGMLRLGPQYHRAKQRIVTCEQLILRTLRFELEAANAVRIGRETETEAETEADAETDTETQRELHRDAVCLTPHAPCRSTPTSTSFNTRIGSTPAKRLSSSGLPSSRTPFVFPPRPCSNPECE